MCRGAKYPKKPIGLKKHLIAICFERGNIAIYENKFRLHERVSECYARP